MSRATLSNAAVSDLRDIWWYTAGNWGVEQADRYADDIQSVCDDLASVKKIGRPVHEHVGYFRYTIARHVIFFKEQGDAIFVARILHERMDLVRHLE